MSGPSSARRPNRLINERSPYLLQHAYNPVDWYPWGDEAFARAAELDRPVLLSIGYSACHWCHVMEEESFNDGEVAKLINDLYVAVKVDREERPDIDAHYMSAAQLLSGGGGWPLTVFLTPERQPFYAATYIPKEARFGMAGLMDLLPTIANHWRSNRLELTALSQRVRSSLIEERGSTSGGGLGEEALIVGFQDLMEGFDEQHGGFGSSPKFPTPHRLTMLLRYWHRTNDPKALWMVDRTLEAMRKGGMYDQVGKGFHRYSTDRAWSIPHYEKMLYDQALLALAYLEGHQATGREPYALTAREVLDSIIEDFSAPEGGFCSAFDADSEGMEGAYYLWSAGELASILSPVEVAEAGRLLGITYEGGHRAALGDGECGKGTLYLKDLSALSDPVLGEIRRKLISARRTRPGPARDDKVMVDWTGLAVAALARGYAVLGETSYLRAADEAVDFVMKNLRAADGGLLHIYRDGPSKIGGFLDDYAFMAWGLIELYQAGHEVRRLREALTLVKEMDDRFWDDEEGGYFMTSFDSGDGLLRRKEVFDGAVPSGNSVALLDLVLLYRITEERELADRIKRTITAFSGSIFHRPDQYAQFMCAVDFRIGPSYSVVISGEDASEDTQSFFRQLAKHYVPNKVVLLNPPGKAGMDLGALSPLVQGQGMKEGRAVAHVCTERTCLPETIDPVSFADLFRSA